MRGEKRTKEIHEDELSRLKNPGERPTSAIDPTELASLVKTTRAPTDDLAIPVESTPPNIPRATPPDERVSVAARAAADAVASEPRAHTPSWSGPTKETAVIVNERPTNDPAPELASRPHRAREHVERISHASLGTITVEPPRGIAPLPKLQTLADTAIPEPTRYPRASTRQPTLDDTTPVIRRGPSPIAMFLALAIPGILLAIAYVLIR